MYVSRSGRSGVVRVSMAAVLSLSVVVPAATSFAATRPSTQVATVGAPTVSASVASGKVTLRWNRVPGAVRYQVLRNDKLVATVTTTSWSGSIGASTSTFSVRSVDKLAVLSLPSTPVTVGASGVVTTTSAAPAAAAPTTVVATTVAKTTAPAAASAAAAIEPLGPVNAPRLPAVSSDGSGATVAVDSIDRIVVLGGDASEIVYSLGLNDKVVGNDLSSIFPATVASKPKVGIFSNFSAEGVIKLKPTIVLAHPNSGPPAAIAAVKAAGIPWFVVPEQTRLTNAPIKIRAIGRALGLADDGNKLADMIAKQIDDAVAGAKSIKKSPVVAYMTYRNNTPYLFGRDSPACTMMVAAGGTCAGTKAGILDLVVPITAEALIPTRPDIIIAPTDAVAAMGGLDAFKALPGVSQTPAAKNGLIFTYDVNFTQGLGPRTGEAVKEFNRLFASIS